LRGEGKEKECQEVRRLGGDLKYKPIMSAIFSMRGVGWGNALCSIPEEGGGNNAASEMILSWEEIVRYPSPSKIKKSRSVAYHDFTTVKSRKNRGKRGQEREKAGDPSLDAQIKRGRFTFREEGGGRRGPSVSEWEG